MSDNARLDARKATARAWFEALQGRIIDAIEQLEANCPGPFAQPDLPPGRFELKPWARTDHTGEPGGHRRPDGGRGEPALRDHS